MTLCVRMLLACVLLSLIWPNQSATLLMGVLIRRTRASQDDVE